MPRNSSEYSACSKGLKSETDIVPGVRTIMIVVVFPILVFGIDLVIMLVGGDATSATRFAILLIAAIVVALLTGIALKKGVLGKRA